jgi:hypothetical protein
MDVRLASAILAILMCVAGCTGAGRPPPHFSRPEIAACRARGGTAETVGLGEKACVVSYADGGRECRDKADCQGRCIFRFGPAFSGHGFCEPDSETRGCYSAVEKGVMVERDIVCED